MKKESHEWKGLTDREVEESRKAFGSNVLENRGAKRTLTLLFEVVSEPMFLLLLVACIIYFIVGEYAEGIVMMIAMILVTSISFFQERRSQKALDAVKEMSQPKARVIRNGKQIEVASRDLVINDILLIAEGEQIPADGIIVYSNDFSVDESILTGESLAVDKNENSSDNKVFLGTTVRSGSAVIKLSSIGTGTMLGKLGKSMEEMKVLPGRFQKEIRSFVKGMAVAGAIAFVFVFLFNYYQGFNILASLLFALTLAMSILPEEIPVAFSTFMALGTWKLLKEKILVKDPQTIETLGSATVICVDKTGTITENKMKLAMVFDFVDKAECNDKDFKKCKRVIEYAMWASEPSPFDPMEVAIHNAYMESADEDRRKSFDFIHEYPLSGAPPVMTHVFENNDGKRIIACKGGAESVVKFAGLNEEDKSIVLQKVKAFASRGYRVLGVASASFNGDDFPKDQKDFGWKFEGLIGLYDPPKRNINRIINEFYSAGIKVKIISGDFPETTKSIAKEIGFHNADAVITGIEIETMDEETLSKTVNEKSIFARMYPEAKLKVINALKANGEVVAMTGDGVNDGLALKAADIGVAMGSRGTEIARRAASMVLLDNDLDKMVSAVTAGRKIYVNLKKAIRYIVSIHISIILTVIVPLILGWRIENIFSPVHIIFFELIMGPTCSIIFENEPVERNLMKTGPRDSSFGFLSLQELSMSIVQGLFITLGVLFIYYHFMELGYEQNKVRTLVFIDIVIANIFLTLVNRSFKDTFFTTLRYKNSLIPLIILITVFLLAAIISYSPLRKIFLFEIPSITEFLICFLAAIISVIWIEFYKAIKSIV